MNFKKISLLILILLIADQLLKIWVKTHMHLDESIIVFPDWFNCALSRITARLSACTSPGRGNSTGGNCCSGYSASSW